MLKEQQTAILIFANSSTEEVRHKKIPNGQVLFSTLTKETVRTVEKTNLPFFLFSEKEQTGNSFGERFTNAIETVFNLGYNHIITIGNDSPQLKASHLKQATKLLEKGKFVLGPSTDGGFYLMGLHRSQFSSIAFKQLPWQTPQLAKKLMGSIPLSVSNNLATLQTLFDIDKLSDLHVLINYTRVLTDRIFKVLIALIEKNKNAIHTGFFHNPPVFLEVYHNKGSPILLHL